MNSKIHCSSCRREIFDIETLPLDGGHIVVVRGWDGDRSRLERFSSMLNFWTFGALVIALKPGETVEILSEQKMAEYGWIRGKKRARRDVSEAPS